jgi:hypothetical protein
MHDRQRLKDNFENAMLLIYHLKMCPEKEGKPIPGRRYFEPEDFVTNFTLEEFLEIAKPVIKGILENEDSMQLIYVTDACNYVLKAYHQAGH